MLVLAGLCILIYGINVGSWLLLAAGILILLKDI